MRKPVLNVSAVKFDAAVRYVDPDLHRIALQCIYAHPHPEGGVVLVATEGRRLVVIRDSEGTCRKPIQVPVPKPLVKALKAARDGDRLTIDGAGFADIPGRYTATTAAIHPKEHPYIDYQRLVTMLLDLVKARREGPASFNAEFLCDVAKVGQRLSSNKGAPVRIVTFGAAEMALTLWPNSPDAFGFLMPMRTDDVNAIPAWFKPVMDAYAPPARSQEAA